VYDFCKKGMTAVETKEIEGIMEEVEDSDKQGMLM